MAGAPRALRWQSGRGSVFGRIAPILVFVLSAIALQGLQVVSAQTDSGYVVPGHYQVTLTSDRSLLDEVGRMGTSVTSEQIAVWQSALHTGKATKVEAARLHLRLGEWALATQEEPNVALSHLRTAAHIAPLTSPQHGQAMYEIAVTHFREGAYRQAADEFKTLVYSRRKQKLTGYSPTNAALFMRHALVCSGYHEERSKLGIPEPPKLDPRCGAAALAVCLRALNLPYDEKTVLANTRVTGLGSNLKDIQDAVTKLGGITGLTSRALSADPAGLKVLPLPMVAYIERDHFVAITRADSRGVTYLCSDCGQWPGGEVHVTWNQWKTLEPSIYLSVVKKNSGSDRLLARAFSSAQKTAMRKLALSPNVQLASAVQGVGVFSQVQQFDQITRQATQIAAHAAIQQIPTHYFSCGAPLYGIHCAGAMIFCTFDWPSSDCGGGDGDPVNLATLEEEYKPAPDLVVYNPKGPSVTWRRYYNSLRAVTEARDASAPNDDDEIFTGCFDFGHGWSNSYAIYIYENNDFNQLVLPNGGRIRFSNPSTSPTVANPTVLCPAQPGCPYAFYKNLDGSITVMGKDGTKWVMTNTSTPRFDDATKALEKIVDRQGNAIHFNYDSNLQLATITDDDNNTLLTINRSTVPGPISVYPYPNYPIASVTDRYERSICYQMGTSGADANSLTHVSQIVPTGTSNPSDRYVFT